MRTLIALIMLLPVSALAVADTESAPHQDEPSAMIVAPEFVMRPRPTDEAEFDEYVEYLVKVADPRTPEQVKQDDGIKARFKDTMIMVDYENNFDLIMKDGKIYKNTL